MTTTDEIVVPDAYDDPDIWKPDAEDVHVWIADPDCPIARPFFNIHHGHIQAVAATCARQLVHRSAAYADVTPGDCTLYTATVIDKQTLGVAHHESKRFVVSFGTESRSGRVQYPMAFQAHAPTDTLISDMCGSHEYTQVVGWVWLSYLVLELQGFPLPWIRRTDT